MYADKLGTVCHFELAFHFSVATVIDCAFFLCKYFYHDTKVHKTPFVDQLSHN